MKSQKSIRKLFIYIIILAVVWTVLPAAVDVKADGEGDETEATTGTGNNDDGYGGDAEGTETTTMVAPGEQPLEPQTVETAPTPVETTMSLLPQQQQGLLPGSTVRVNLMIDNTVGLYGLQVSCQVDPAILSWQNAEFAGFFTDPLVGTNNTDPASGSWVGAISQKNPAPALDGTGIFATLTFQAIAPGTTTLACQPLAANRSGFEMPASVGSTSIVVENPPVVLGQLAGSVLYQGRLEHAGIQVTISGATEKGTVTEMTGQFELTDLQADEYNVIVDADMYLPTCTDISVNGEAKILDTILLVGGDTDDDNEIRINDATLIGSNFGLTASNAPAMNPRADINGDGQVNVQDLSILGGNFGKSGCQPWTPDASLTNSMSTVTSS